MTQFMYVHPEEVYGGRPAVISHVTQLKENNPNLTVIDVGASHNPFHLGFLTHTVDFQPFPNDLDSSRVQHQFIGNLNSFNTWNEILRYIDEKRSGEKFDFCNCTHTLEDLAYPMLALEMMPKIAKQGFIAVPSKYWELQRRELWRGADHHRWIWDISKDGQILVAYPKISLIDYLNYFPYNKLIEESAHSELRVAWFDDIKFEVINNDYLGPDPVVVRKMYQDLIP